MCRLADIQSKSVLLQIVRQGSPEKMVALVERLGREGVTRAEARRLVRKVEPKRGRGRPRHFLFRFNPKGSDFSLSLQFKRPEVDRGEVIRTLEAILDDLRKQS
jgi:ParB family chromosome partitioning protein